jgi:hypothetical protein
VEAEDPMELYATPVAGNPEVMLRCAVEEYARLGWDAEQVLALFCDPYYPALHGLLELYGEAAVRQQIAAVFERTGVFHVTVRELEVSEDGSAELPLVELQIPAALVNEGRIAGGN